jgi:ATP-binding cassette subfamily B protein
MALHSLLGKIRQLIAARWAIVRLTPRAGPGLVALLVTANLVLGVLPVIFVIITSIVLGRLPSAVIAGSGSAAWHWVLTLFAVAAAALILQQVISPLVLSLDELMARRIDGLAFRELMAASLRSTGIGPLEDQHLRDELREAVRSLEFAHQSPGRACTGQLRLISRYTQLAGYAIAIGLIFSWLAAAGLVVTVLLFRHGQRGGLRRFAEAVRRLDRLERKSGYLRALAIEAAAGKEIRVFGLADWLTDGLREAYLTWLKPLWAARRRIYLWPFIWYAAWGLIVTGVVFGITGADAGRTLVLTSFVLVMQASLGAIRLSEFYPEADVQTAVGMSAYDAIQQFAAGVEAFAGQLPAGDGNDLAPQGKQVPREVPDPVAAIRFDNVTFSYPGEERKVLDGLNLTIPVGRCTAIVGLNGAGKTTLVKLLARLYEPTSGSVRADGVDIASYPVDAWRAKLGVIFQDFARFEASAADNIGFGAVSALGDREMIRATARAAGIAGALDALPRGLDTPLARHLAGGTDLSDGQWQRIALGRALFALRHGSPVVVLDEPTANLDVRSEASFFEEFAFLTAGATTVLISHRFSTVRRADFIVVLDHGQVAEQGSHEELLAAGGKYARLFRLQADRFSHASACTVCGLASADRTGCACLPSGAEGD